MAIKFKTTEGKEVKSGDVIYLKLKVPAEKSMPIGRFDKIINDLQKNGLIEYISEEQIKD